MTDTNTLTRADLIAGIAEETGLQKTQAAAALSALEACVTQALASGARVRLLGLGTLQVKDRPARSGAIAGKPYSVAGGQRLAFKPSTALKQAINPD